jgi:peptidoglycan/xylan/chitin deacetylase (PgdA/CDA1 family)
MTAKVHTTCSRPGLFALTFDDGIFDYTNKLLDILSFNQVKATFFVNGYKTGDLTVEPYRSVLLRMYREGHQIASHTYDHFNLAKLNTDGVYSQMKKNDIALKQVLGVEPVYMRPPFGSYNSDTLTALGSWGYKVIWINLSNRDASNSSFEAMKLAVDPILANSNPLSSSFISLQHDSIPTSVEPWTQYLIDQVQRKGFRFVTTAECIGDSGPWYR